MFLDELLNKQDCYQNKQAVVCEEESITYKDLEENVNKMGQLLLENGVASHDNVVICMNKSIEYIISIFSILNVGAAYIPLDNNMPLERYKYILENSESSVIITDKESIENVRVDGKTYIVIDHYKKRCEINGSGIIGWNPNMNYKQYTISNRSIKDIAYIIYTSGSTGTPKGVMIRHESVVAFVKSINDAIGYSDKTKYLNVSPLYFDASIVDIFCTLSVGGTLVLMKKFVFPNKLIKAIVDYEITDTLLVSSILKLLASKYLNLNKYDLSKLRTIWYGAESCPISVIQIIKQAIPHIRFIHGYGPTEATHTTTMLVFDEVPDNKTGFMPIGKPLPNVEVLALNENNKSIKESEIGMLYIGGLQLFEGYCNDPVKNSLFLIENFLNTGKRYYKTNDMVTVDEEGNYIYVGRSDDMVKVSGKLVYINEVESILLKCEEIKDAIIVTIDDQFFAKKMICFIVFKQDRKKELRNVVDFAKQKLQSYMIPSKFYVLDENEIPRNQNDKVDRKALEELAKNCNK